MARRTYGTGSVTPYSEGTWRLRWWDNGKQRSKVVAAASKKEANALLRRELTAVDEGVSVEPSRLTVAELMARHLTDTGSDLAESSAVRYAQVTRLHILPHLGSKRLQSLKPHHLSSWLTVLREAEVGARTIQQAYDRLHTALDWAYRMEWVKQNVLSKVDRPQARPEPIFPLTFAESHQFLAVADTDGLAPLWRLYLSTGLRRGEALGLRWADLDLVAGKLSVRQQVVPGSSGGGAVIKQVLKTSAARRTFGIDPLLVEKLISHQEHQVATRLRTTRWFPHDLVFCTRNGLPLRPRNLYRDYEPLLERAGVAARTLHNLRHSHATHLLLQGVSVLEVSARLGHASPNITLSTYSHWIPGHHEASIEAIRGMLAGALPELEG
jgi:integrase